MKRLHLVRSLAVLLTTLPLFAAAPVTRPATSPAAAASTGTASAPATRPDTPQQLQTRALVRTIKIAVATFEIDTGRLPTTKEGVAALVTAPADAAGQWRGPYLEKVPLDAWGNEFVYLGPKDAPDGRYLVLSGGAVAVTGRGALGAADALQKVRLAMADLAELREGLALFLLDNGRIPSTQEGLDGLVRLPADIRMLRTWRPILGAIPKDPWGHNYLYVEQTAPGSTTAFELASPGPDGTAGTEDDIPLKRGK